MNEVGFITEMMPFNCITSNLKFVNDPVIYLIFIKRFSVSLSWLTLDCYLCCAMNLDAGVSFFQLMALMHLIGSWSIQLRIRTCASGPSRVCPT